MKSNFDTVSVNHVRLEEESDNKSQQTSEDIINDVTFTESTWKGLICFVIPLALLMMIYAIIDSALLILIPLYSVSQLATKNNNHETIAGLIITVQGIGIVLSGPFVGKLIHQSTTEFGVIIAALLRTVCIFTLFLYSNSVFLWCFIMFLYGASCCGNSVSVNSLISRWIPSAQRGRCVSLINGMRRAGSTLGPLFAGHIREFDASLLIASIISTMSLFVVCCLMSQPNFKNESSYKPGSFKYFKHAYKETFNLQRMNIRNWTKYTNEHSDTENVKISKDKAGAGTFLFIWKSSNYRNLLITVSVFAFGLNWVRMTRKLILTFHANDLNMNQQQIGNINSLSFFPDTCMFPLAGILMDKFGRKVPASTGLLLFILALSVISFTKNFAGLAVVGFIFGMADGITSGLLMTWAADVASQECKAQFIGQFRTIVGIPSLLGPVIIGSLCSNVSLFSASVLSGIIGFIALIWTVFVLKEPRNHGQSDENMLKNEIMQNEKEDENQSNGNALMMTSLDDEFTKQTVPQQPVEKL